MALTVSGIGLWRGGTDIALIVALTMLLVVIAGSLIGVSLPFILDRFRLDPAASSAPLITSIADGIGAVVYLALASALLSAQ
jgi:magnesium transporter